jgi:hypothetical protein
MDALLLTEASPASNQEGSTPPSPNHDASTYGTPGDHAGPSSPTTKGNDKDPQLVVSAGRSLKNMFVDLMSVLETQAKTQIFVQGDITLRIQGRETYTVSLFNAEGIEPSDLKVRISKASDNAPEFPTEQTNGTGNAMAEASLSRKRDRDENNESDQVSPTDNAEGTPKRARVGSGEHEPSSPEITRDSSSGNAQVEPDSTEATEPTVTSRLQNVSAQIKWVEECRRIADEAHDRREETWRTSSATFHDNTRKARERHESWMVQEMNWQRNLLLGMANDLKGLYPLGHSLKWGSW